MNDVILPALGELLPFYGALLLCYLLAKADLKWDIGARILNSLMAYDERRKW